MNIPPIKSVQTVMALSIEEHSFTCIYVAKDQTEHFLEVSKNGNDSSMKYSVLHYEYTQQQLDCALRVEELFKLGSSKASIVCYLSENEKNEALQDLIDNAKEQQI